MGQAGLQDHINIKDNIEIIRKYFVIISKKSIID